jgi:hypothetical protein
MPMTYRGITFRSVLEANWAATFDSLDWLWSYEPEPVIVDGTAYLCDFYLYNQRLWCEAKGPHDERIEKPRILQRYFDREYDMAMAGNPTEEWWIAAGAAPLVVIVRPPGPGDRACWEAASEQHSIVLAECRACHGYYFMDADGDWACRYGCRRPAIGKPYNGFWRSGEFPFTRAPRASAAA